MGNPNCRYRQFLKENSFVPFHQPERCAYFAYCLINIAKMSYKEAYFEVQIGLMNGQTNDVILPFGDLFTLEREEKRVCRPLNAFVERGSFKSSPRKLMVNFLILLNAMFGERDAFSAEITGFGLLEFLFLRMVIRNYSLDFRISQILSNSHMNENIIQQPAL